MTTETITVRLFAGLEAQTALRRAEMRVAVVEAPTVADVCANLSLDLGAVGIVLVNGLHARADKALAAGDEVSLFPPLGGG
jgi:sulfur-carrier protein